MSLEEIYLRLPAYLQNLVVSIEGARINYRRYGGNYKEIYQQIKVHNSISYGEIRAYQSDKLKRMLSIARNSKFWNDEFNKYNVNTKNCSDPFSELSKLPVYTKEIIKDNVEDIFVSTGKKYTSIKTSGTSGSGLKLFRTYESERITYAAEWLWRERFGVKKGTWCGYFCGRTVVPLNNNHSGVYRVNWPGKQVLFSNYHLSINTIDKYIEKLNKLQPDWIHGYPSFLATLVSLAKSKNISLKYSPKLVTISSESLMSYQKDAIESFFRTEVQQIYGQSEGVSTMYSENGILVPDDKLAITEFIKSDCYYKIIGTNLINENFPLFRYETGDIVSDYKNIDGRIFPLEIDGRIEDSIELFNGVKIGRLDHVFKSAINVNEAQIYQRRDLSLDVKLVVNSDWNLENEMDLKMEFLNRIGEHPVRFIYLDRLPRTKNGKLRFVVRE